MELAGDDSQCLWEMGGRGDGTAAAWRCLRVLLLVTVHACAELCPVVPCDSAVPDQPLLHKQSHAATETAASRERECWQKQQEVTESRLELAMEAYMSQRRFCLLPESMWSNTLLEQPSRQQRADGGAGSQPRLCCCNPFAVLRLFAGDSRIRPAQLEPRRSFQ